MQIAALRVFCDVARLRSISQAASLHDLTQSAVSQLVLGLEKSLGVRLIDRSTRPLQVTAPGRAYAEGCRQLLEQYDILESSIRQTQAQHDATIQVAAIYSVGLGDLGEIVERFIAQHPGTKVHVEHLHPDRVRERVREGIADLGLISFPRGNRDLLALPWREEPIVLACPPQHPLAAQATVRPAQLEGERFVGFDRDLMVRRHLDRFLRQHGVTVEMVMEFDNIESIKKAVELSGGVALLPGPTLRREVEAGTLAAVPLAGARLVRPLGIIHSRHQRLPAAAASFIELLRQGPPAGPAPIAVEPAIAICANGTAPRPRLARGPQRKAPPP